MKAIVIVYDITDRISYDETTKWITSARAASPKARILLVGNKADLNAHRTVASDEGEGRADELDVGFMEASAVSGFNLDKVCSCFF